MRRCNGRTWDPQHHTYIKFRNFLATLWPLCIGTERIYHYCGSHSTCLQLLVNPMQPIYCAWCHQRQMLRKIYKRSFSPHISHLQVMEISFCCIQELNHPSYTPDLAPVTVVCSKYRRTFCRKVFPVMNWRFLLCLKANK